MIFIAIGCFAFVFFYIFDLNKIIFLHKTFNICFATGVAFLIFSTLGILFGDFEQIETASGLRIIFSGLSIVSLLLMLYSLFFALPFGKTYMGMEKENNVVDTGMYALCRHPGVIWFFFFYLFLWLASGIKIIFWAAFIWTVMDIIHVYVQDRWLFPKTLKRYELYKKNVPFLIPDFNSIKRMFMTLH